LLFTDARRAQRRAQRDAAALLFSMLLLPLLFFADALSHDISPHISPTADTGQPLFHYATFR
jgi:hypothetical protein